MKVPVWPTYIVDYQFEGATYSIYLSARDATEAQARVNTAAASGDVIGELVATIPCTRARRFPLLLDLYCFLKNRNRMPGTQEKI